MLESVSEANRSDPLFLQAVRLANHLAICRNNWLGFMVGGRNAGWRNDPCDLAVLPSCFAALESQWTHYLAHLDEDRLVQDFEFTENGKRFHLPVEVQIIPLIGHTSYHRGQIALLVSQLGSETVDTDYADWWWDNQSQK